MKKKFFSEMMKMFGPMVMMVDDTDEAGAGSGSVTQPLGDGTDLPGVDPTTLVNAGEGDGDDAGAGADDDAGERKATAGEADDAGTGDDDKNKNTSGAAADNDKFAAFGSKLDAILAGINKDVAGSADDGEKGTGSILDLEHNDLVTKFQEDPKGVLAAVAEEARQKTLKDVQNLLETDKTNSSIQKTYQTYAEKNPDFATMWEKGDIQKYMDANPGHNAISAHMAMTVDARIEAARKEAAEKAAKNFKNKKNNQVMGGGSGARNSNSDAMLKDPKKYGGRAAVAARRAGLI
mgnify:CR=1 FL=1